LKSKHLIIVISIVILFFGIASPIIGVLSSLGIIENRLATKNLIVTEKYYDEGIPFNGVLNAAEKIKTDIKNIYSNCIPFYNLIVSSVQNAELKLLNITDSILQTMLYPEYETENNISLNNPHDKIGNLEYDRNINTEYATPSELESQKEYIRYNVSRLQAGRPNIYSIEPLKVLERLEGASDKELQNLMEHQLDYLDRLYNAAPELNYYCYMGTRIQETDFYSDIVKNPKSTASYFKIFKENLNDNYSFDYLHIDTPEDRVSKLYRTDHHWNMFGAYEGYQQIINMMYERTPEIGQPSEYDIIKIDGLQWFGSMAATVGFNDSTYLDDFYVMDLTEFPEHTAGNGYKIQRKNTAYMSGKYPSGNLYFDYHGAYYQPQKSYNFPDNSTGRNLLLIGDSYSWSIAHILAAHFDTTIVYNTPWMIADSVKYDYKKIIEENKITDVLILLYSSRLLFGYDGTDFDNFLDP